LDKFAISRVLGNELTPRDLPGSCIKTLKFILSTEPKFCRRIWIINHVHSKDLRSQYIDLLKEYNEEYEEIKFNKRKYKTLQDYNSQVTYAININHARNYGFKITRRFAEFTFIFDGDCFFDKAAWEITTNEIVNSDSLPYYGVPGIRITGSVPKSIENHRLWEPSLVFRHNTKALYNESVPFGKSERIELMKKIGYSIKPNKLPMPEDETLCKNVGYLFHISFSEEELETDLRARIKTRNKSINNLLKELNAPKMI